jgi:hypothetical protein
MLSSSLDFIRARTLRWTLRLPFTRELFVRRELRTPFWFLISLGINLFLVFRFPQIPFYWGPLLLGVPHLLASFRYGVRSKDGFPLYLFCSLLMAVSLWAGGAQWMVLFPMILLLVGMNREGRGLRTLPAMAIVIVLAGGFFIDGYRTALILAILHNFVAFAFWFRETRSRPERLGVFLALFGTIVAALLIPVSTGSGEIGDIAFLLTGLSPEPEVVRFTRIFLLTQSLHYFIWLKALPDQVAPSKVPRSFRGGVRDDRLWFGRSVHAVVLLVAGGLLALAFHSGLEPARRFYVQLAAFHGFAEFVFLSLRVRT